ncbi:MAG TPA: Rieske 2Fe-2S domain-containing protein [Acidimicrobiia bacterium]|nr:Rieske 2Fe-2S domain-containing protein [Acidimicrobiia bacterium]
MLVASAIALLVVLAVAAVVATPRTATVTGTLHRETRRRDYAPARRPATPDRRHLPEPTAPRTPARRERPDEEMLGVTRRQFVNRSLFAGLGLGVAAFATSTLAFLWPRPAAGFGSKITVGSTADAAASFATKQPFYNATAKTYIVPYPKAALPKAKKVAAYTAPILAGMQAGYVALYQTCPHLGCRVPWCQTSQWFECPCHGSKYNEVGEKQGGPAPRGMDRFVFEVSGGNIVVDTGNLVLGPPIGTNTTGQSPAGPPCV